MGKKGSWFSAIKRVFLPHSKDKVANEPEKKSSSKDKKKKGIGKFRQGESSSSFIPLFREPSSIEKILDEAEREHKLTFRPPTPPAEQPRTPTFVPPSSRVVSSSPRVPSLPVSSSPRPASSPRAPSPKAAASPRPPSPKAATPSTSARATSPKNVERERQVYRRIEPTLRNQNACATKIQAAYRGYVARRSFRALKGLVRLQGVIRGQNVKRQTMNAMKCMQLLVRVQSQIQSRRIQMLENQARQHKNNDKELESHKWSQASEAGQGDDWDDSVLTKDQVEARIRSKMDAVIKRERAMAYAYSHQLWKASPRATQLSLTDIRSNGFPWWWNWLERQLPAASSSNNNKESQPTTTTKSFQLTPTRPSSSVKPSPIHQQQHFPYDGFDTPTPRSTMSTARQLRTPVHKMTPNNNAANNSSGLSKYSRARGGGDHSSPSPFNFPSKDDDSLTSCPPFSRPNYMTPTASAKAKARANSNPKERFPLPGTPSSEKRRVSFPFGGTGQSFKWNAGSLFSSNSNKGSGSPRVIDKQQPIHSIGNLSVDSTVSMPAALGRRPFNRFV